MKTCGGGGRLRRPKIEAVGRERGWGFRGRGSKPLPTSWEVWGSSAYYTRRFMSAVCARDLRRCSTALPPSE